MNEVTVGIIGLATALALFLTGIELGFAMALVGFLGFSFIVSTPAALNLLAKDFFEVFSNYGFTVVPLFILMGQIAYNAGIAKRLYDAAYKLIGHIPGGLAMATAAGSTAFGTVTGSCTATAATFASVAYPEMNRYNYGKSLSTGIIAVGGTLGSLVPPSVTLIVYGMITEQSIGKLFLAALIPGLIISLFFIFIIYGMCKINPSLGPKAEVATWKERMSSLKEVIGVLIIFLIVTGGMSKGLFTPTEAGSAGTFAVLLLSIVKRDISFRGFILSVSESLRTACMTLMLIAGSTILGHFLVVTKIPIFAADWIMQLDLPPYIVMVLILLVFELGGSFIDDLAFMVLAVPIFYPIVIKLGYDPIWFGIIIHIFVMIGVVIPPVAINVFVVKNITNIPFSVIYKGVYPFLLSMILCAVLLFIFPQITLYLPNALMLR
ncbi:MAG: TRAP transporter large permease [Deltaproteobacteria bacterium]|nr:TRAP transporter large permease [Deltaproteobacteria bacterium]